MAGESTWRTLTGLALDQKDWDAATKYHQALVAMEPTSRSVKGELGQALYDRGEYERAEVALGEVVRAAAGERALAPALRDTGRAQAKAHKSTEALETLKKALAAAGAQNALRAQIYEVVAEIYRAVQELPVLIRQLEAERATHFA